MAAVVEGSLSYEGVGKSKESMGEPQDAVIFVGISLVLGIACRHILKGTRVPYTVALLIAGIAMGSLGVDRCLSIAGGAVLFVES